MSSDPTVFSILLGRHLYSMTPELETAWCRVCMLLGWIAGIITLHLLQ